MDHLPCLCVCDLMSYLPMDASESTTYLCPCAPTCPYELSVCLSVWPVFIHHDQLK